MRRKTKTNAIKFKQRKRENEEIVKCEGKRTRGCGFGWILSRRISVSCFQIRHFCEAQAKILERERSGKRSFLVCRFKWLFKYESYALILFTELPDIFVTVNLFWKRYYSAVNVTKSSPKTNCKFAIQFFLFLPIFLTLYYF